MKTSSSGISWHGGFSLVEVTLALGIAAFTLLAVFGLMPVGMNATYSSGEQTMAADLATAIASDLQNTPPSGTAVTSQIFKISIPVTGGTLNTLYFDEAGVAATTLDSVKHRYRAEIYLRRPSTTSALATVGELCISWPATRPSANAQGALRVPIALDRNYTP